MACGCSQAKPSGKSGCGCGTSKCNCTIIDQKGRPFEGSGTACDPYIIPRDDGKCAELHSNDDGTYTFVPCEGDPVLIETCCCPVARMHDNGDGSWLFVDANGDSTLIDVCQAMADHCPFTETVTNITVNPDGSFDYVNEAGVTVNYAPPVEVITTLIDNGDGTYSYTNEAGVVTVITAPAETVTTLIANIDGSYTYTSESGVVTTIPPVVIPPETVTGFTPGANCGEIVYTDEAGVMTTIDFSGAGLAGATVTPNPDGTITIADGCTNPITLPAPSDETLTGIALGAVCGTLEYTAEDGLTTVIPFNNAGLSGATAVTNADGSITLSDGCGAAVTLNPNPSTLVYNGDGTATHTGSTGTDVTIDACQMVSDGGCLPSIIPGPGAAEYTFNDGHGNTSVINVNEIDMDINSVVLTGSELTFTSEDGTTVVVDICAVVAANCSDSLVVNVDGSVTHTAIDGTVTTIPPAAGETVTTIVYNNDGTWSYTNEAATVVTLDVCAMIADGGCTDSLVANPDGTYTHTALDGTVVIITPPAPSTIVDNGNGTITHSDGTGTDVVLDICAIVGDGGCTDSFVDNGDGTATHTALDGTIVSFDVCAMIGDGGCTDTLVVNVDGSVTHTALDGTVTTIPASAGETVTTIVNNGDGTATYNNEAAAPVTLDVCAMVNDGGCLPTITAGPGTTEYTFNDGHGNTSVINVNEIDMDINSVTITGSTITFTAEDGTTVNADICAIVAANCSDSLVVNVDGSVTHTAIDGTVVTIPAPAAGAVSTLVDNGDGTATHSDGNGTNVTLDICAMVDDGGCTDSYTFDVATGVTTHTALDGTVVTHGPTVDCDGDPFLPGDSHTRCLVNPDGTAVPTNGSGSNITQIDDTTTNADIGTAADPGAEWGIDPATGDLFYVDAAGNWQPVPCCTKSAVTVCGGLDPAVGPALGEVVPSVFCMGDNGTVSSVCFTGLDNGMDGTVIVEVVVDGVATAQTVTLNPVGAGQAIVECLDLVDIPLSGAGPHTVSYYVSGGTATTGFPTGVTAEFMGNCA